MSPPIRPNGEFQSAQHEDAPGSGPGSPGGPVTAADRLTLSRERIRRAMLHATAPKGGTRTDDDGASWLEGLKSIPGSKVLIEAVGSWWAQHPLRVAGMVAADAAKTVVRPVAQRHPLGLVLGALVLGGVLAWSRPWRWLLTPALFAGLVPQLVSKAMALVPPRSWMAVLASLMQEQSRPVAAPQPDGQPPFSGRPFQAEQPLGP